MPDQPSIYFRQLMPNDSQKLVELYERLSAESRFYRFQANTEYLDQATIKQYAQQFALVDYPKDYALAACYQDQQQQEQIIGVARYMRHTIASTKAEFAIVVQDDWQGKGVGSQLMRQLCQTAYHMRIDSLQGSFIAHNEGIIKLLVGIVPSQYLDFNITEGEGNVCIRLRAEWIEPHRISSQTPPPSSSNV